MVFALLLLLSLEGTGRAQNHVVRAMERARERREALARAAVNSEKGKGESGYLPFRIEDGDTVFFDKLAPIWVFGRRKTTTEKDWRDYYKLVYRFPRVYPYAEAAGYIQHDVDSIITARHMNFIAKDRFITDVQKQLFSNFEGAFRQMTITQGALLMKLIDRETGQSSYSIIKEYKSGVAAGFWQVIAKMFDNDLKTKYDPHGVDKEVEELVQIWKAGEFKNLYWSVFWEYPPEITVQEIKLK